MPHTWADSETKCSRMSATWRRPWPTPIYHNLCKPGVNFIKLLQVLFTSLNIILESTNNSFTCKCFFKKLILGVRLWTRIWHIWYFKFFYVSVENWFKKKLRLCLHLRPLWTNTIIFSNLPFLLGVRVSLTVVMSFKLHAQCATLFTTVNLRNGTVELVTSVTVIYFWRTFRQLHSTSLSTYLFIKARKTLMVSVNHDKTRK